MRSNHVNEFEIAYTDVGRGLGEVVAQTSVCEPSELNHRLKSVPQQAEQMLAAGMGRIAEATLPKLLAPQTLTGKPEVVARVREMILLADPQGAAAAQRGMAARRNYSEDLSGINVPTLVIVGRDDPIRPVADAEFMHDRIRDSRLEIIEDAAHMTNMEQPEVFNELLLRLTEELSDLPSRVPG